ncbi:MAG: TldD/PmbA family protein, partial [Thermoplasmata archaeon]|nr:TldD/PmbA family protein [Thermoplasmata archaeon]
IAIRILKDKKMGFAYCTALEGVVRALNLAIQGASIVPERPFEFPADENYYTIPDLLDRRVLELSPEDGMEFASRMIDSARDAHKDIDVTGGGVSFGEEEVVIMNTRGLEVSEHLSGMSASVYTVFNSDHPTPGFEYDSSHLILKDYDEIGRKAAELAAKGQNPVKIGSKKMPVVLRPDAISSLFEFILVPALYGINVGKGESVYTGKLGTEIASPDLSLVDDPTMPDGENAMKMDDEGVPSRRIELIRNGVLKDFLYTIKTGVEFDHPSTSSGLRGGYTSPVSTSGRNIILKGDTEEEDTLISEIKEGLLIHELMGAHTSNPASGDFSVTGSILFRIENGEVTGPVSQAMLSGNLPEYLKNVSGLGNNYRNLSGGLTAVGFYMPSVRIEGVRVTGEK